MGFLSGLGSLFGGGAGATAGAGLLGGGLGAIGIGALIGGLGAKQRGGNFLKGALTGAALGGVTGGMGQKLGGAGGLFGWGANKWGNLLPAAGIFMGSEMAGQQEANLLQKLGQQRWRDEEEERRLARLSKIAGYNVADPKRFMTPDKFFGRAARGGYQSRPQYQLGGPTSMEDDPANAVNMQPLQMDPGTMGPGQLTEEFDYMDEASLNPEIQKLYRAFLVANQTTEEEVPVEMFMQLMQQAGGQEGGGQEAMMAARGGRVHARRGRYLPDPDDDDIRYDEDLIDIFEDDSAMFHGDYDVADEWKKGGIATVPRQNFLLGGLGVAMAKLARKDKASDLLKDTYEKNMGAIDQDQEGIMADTGEGPGFEELKTWAEGDDEGFTYDIEMDGKDYDFSFAERLTDDPEKRRKIIEEIMRAARLKQPEGRLLQDTIDTTAEDMMTTGASGFIKRAVGDITEDVDMGWQDYMGKAKGGIADLDLRGGGASFGPGTGTSDDIPAMLSDGEFVVTANAVENLGGGDRMLGAQRMYRMMNQLDPNSQAPSEISGVGYA